MFDLTQLCSYFILTNNLKRIIIMKTAIFYFTGTGNSLYAAKELGKHLEGHVDLLSIPQELKGEMVYTSYDKIGFVFPLYYTGIPIIVDEFIRTAVFNNVKYSFALTTSGVITGISGLQVKQLLKEKSLTLHFNTWLFFTSNYIREYSIANKSKINKMMTKNNKIIQKVANQINKNIQRRVTANPLIRLIGRSLYKKWRKGAPLVARTYTTTESCKSCSVCVKLCPINNIVIENNRVKWGDKCQDCLSCIHNCPKESIQILGITEDRGRYINPTISLDELISSNN